MILDKIKKAIIIIPAAILLAPTILSCSKQDPNTTYLRVLNSEDYIYTYDEEEAKEGGNDRPNLTVQFEQYMEKKGKKVKVIYETFDTMENMFNIMSTGKTKYDLICASEYMIQKLAKLDKIVPLDIANSIPNYNEYCSPFIKKKLSNIPAKGGELKSGQSLYDYTVCYMWGTLGIIYNPEYKAFKERGYSKQEVIDAMNDWGSLWDSRFKKTISIKDSMRDTYAVGLLHKYKQEMLNCSTFEERQKIFDYGGEDDPQAQEHINAVRDELLKLRNNIFGFEVDSGKDDIVTGKIGIDTAWSGDAVHSMDEGDDPKTNVKLYYSIPTDVGTNLWFDCWAMPKEANVEMANEFLDFISNPANAIQNMDYIGYTSPIANDATFEYFRIKYEGEEGNKKPINDAVKYDLDYFFNRDEATGTYVLNVDKEVTMRQLGAQFPNTNMQEKLMIMKDYGKNNDLILKMWEQVKHESLPTWAIILFSIEGAIILGGISTIVIIRTKNKRRRKLRKLTTNKAN